MTLTFKEFHETKAPMNDELWKYITTEAPVPSREACHVYADSCLVHEADGQFWVHAWWYPPVGYPTLEVAEVALYAWYSELN